MIDGKLNIVNRDEFPPEYDDEIAAVLDELLEEFGDDDDDDDESVGNEPVPSGQPQSRQPIRIMTGYGT